MIISWDFLSVCSLVASSQLCRVSFVCPACAFQLRGSGHFTEGRETTHIVIFMYCVSICDHSLFVLSLMWAKFKMCFWLHLYVVSCQLPVWKFPGGLSDHAEDIGMDLCMAFLTVGTSDCMYMYSKYMTCMVHSTAEFISCWTFATALQCVAEIWWEGSCWGDFNPAMARCCCNSVFCVRCQDVLRRRRMWNNFGKTSSFDIFYQKPIIIFSAARCTLGLSESGSCCWLVIMYLVL